MKRWLIVLLAVGLVTFALTDVASAGRHSRGGWGGYYGGGYGGCGWVTPSCGCGWDVGYGCGSCGYYDGGWYGGSGCCGDWDYGWGYGGWGRGGRHHGWYGAWGPRW